MSVDRKLYTCRFAPNGENPAHAIRVSQPVTQRGESVDEAFAPQAFAGTQPGVPILLDHDDAKRAGTVVVMVAHKDWHIADFVLDGPYAARAAEYIERSGRVSPGFTELDKDPISAMEPCPMNWYTAARLDEISILPPGAIAWYQGAKVTRVVDLPPRSTSPTSGLAADEGEVILGGQHIIRRNVGRVLAVEGRPLLRTSSGQAIRREGRDYVIDQADGSSLIYHGIVEARRAGLEVW